MNLEDLLEAQLAGEPREVPDALADDLKHALAAHDALQFALGETILLPATDADDRTPPQLPTDYEIVRELGRGGMGVVYLARQKSLDRLVAVKVLRPGEMAFGPMVRRFLDEARHLARLRHPNLVSVHEVGEAGGEPYFSMDYIEGESLADMLRRERLSPSRALALLNQAAEAVAHAHQTGIIHRDLKPANILIDAAGRAYVTDFGLARNLTDESDRTHSGAVMGTPQYMAPEQARGETRLVGETTDVHALGAVLYEMLTGRPPYGNDNPMQVLVRLVHEEAKPPRRIDPRISRDLETICLKALAKQPQARYTTVRAMLEDIHRYETGQPLMARRPGIGHRAKSLARRYGKLVAAAVVAAAIAAAAVWTIAPKPVDRSLDELIAWAEAERGGGREAEAVKIYRRALLKATPAQRPKLFDRMVQCVSEIDDPREAVANALQLLDDAPDATFGKYDVLVAQSLLTRLQSQYPSWVGSYHLEHGSRVPNVPDAARPLMQLLERRLAIALKGPAGTPDERRACEELLATLREQLAGRSVGTYDTHDRAKAVVADPQSAPADLLACAGDENIPPPLRIQAAYQAGEKLEKSGDTEAASAAYAEVIAIFPFYALKAEAPSPQPSAKPDPLDSSKLVIALPLFRLPEPGECRWVREAYAGWQRVVAHGDLPLPDDLRGGLRIRSEGFKLPPGLQSTGWLDLQPAAEPLDDQKWRRIWLPELPVWVGVADGRYRLRCNSWSQGWPTSRKDLGDLVAGLVVDSSALPKEVEVRGETLDLPPIQFSLPAEIKPLSPSEGASVDLREHFFRWTPVANTATYEVTFALDYLGNAGWPGMATKGLAGIKTTSAGLCLGVLKPAELNILPRDLIRGTTGIWHVSAFDAQNKLIGKTYRGARFLVARGLGDAWQ